MHDEATHPDARGTEAVASRRRLLQRGGIAAAATAAGAVALTATEASAEPLAPVYLPITPVRAYDSRQVGGVIRPGQTRTLTGTSDPSTFAYLYNLTVVNTTASGFLAVYAADEVYQGHSNINWYGSNQIVANNVYTAARVSDSGINIYCRGGGPTHFVLDLMAVLTVVDLAGLQSPALRAATEPVPPSQRWALHPA